MKIAIISDSHDRLSSLKPFFEIIEDEKIDYIFHAGDVVFPPFFNEFFKRGLKVFCVKGNNDGEVNYLKETLEKNGGKFFYEYMEIEFENRKILMQHKPDLLKSIAKSGDYDVIIFGHTHKVVNEKIGNTLFLNPGTLSGYLAEFKSFMILDLKDLNVQIKKF